MKTLRVAHIFAGLAHAAQNAIVNLVAKQTDQRLGGHQKGTALTDYPEPDNFEQIYADPDENLMWEVVGYSVDGRGNRKFQTIVGNLANKELAEAFIRVYTEKYVNENLF